MFEERFYRDYMSPPDLLNFTVIEEESDLNISAGKILYMEALLKLKELRNDIKSYAKEHLEFYKSLTPVNISNNAPLIVKEMGIYSRPANVGPMASVAGAISQFVGLELLKYTDEVIVENGGDIFIKTNKDRKILIYAGQSPFSNKVALLIPKNNSPIGVCTSAGTIGHSLSFGKADAAVLVSKNTLLADAAATAVCNVVKSPEDINKGIELAMSIKGIEGVLIIIKDKLGVYGSIELVKP